MLYNRAAAHYENNAFGRERPMYGIVGITRVLEDVELSQREHPPYRDMQRFLEQDLATVHTNEINIPDKLRPYLSARIDVKLMSAAGDLQIKYVSDDKAIVDKPAWFQKGGIGYKINSYAGQLTFTTKATVDGQLNLQLKGFFIPNPADKTKRVPYWIDYTKLIVNNETILNEVTPAWHDKPYGYNLNVKADEETTIKIEWLPHRSDT